MNKFGLVEEMSMAIWDETPRWQSEARRKGFSVSCFGLPTHTHHLRKTGVIQTASRCETQIFFVCSVLFRLFIFNFAEHISYFQLKKGTRVSPFIYSIINDISQKFFEFHQNLDLCAAKKIQMILHLSIVHLLKYIHHFNQWGVKYKQTWKWILLKNKALCTK